MRTALASMEKEMTAPMSRGGALLLNKCMNILSLVVHAHRAVHNHMGPAAHWLLPLAATLMNVELFAKMLARCSTP